MRRTINLLAVLMFAFAVAFGVQVNTASATTVQCSVSQTTPCQKTIDTGDTLDVTYTSTAKLTLVAYDDSFTNTAQILPTIGSQAQQPFNIQAGGTIAKSYETGQFNTATFTNQSALGDTKVMMTITSSI